MALAHGRHFASLVFAAIRHLPILLGSVGQLSLLRSAAITPEANVTAAALPQRPEHARPRGAQRAPKSVSAGRAWLRAEARSQN